MGEQILHAQPRGLKMLQKCFRVRRVLPQAVRRHVPRFRGIGDQHAAGTLHPRQAPARRRRPAQPQRARQLARQRVITAGVQDHQVGLAAHHLPHVGKLHGAAFQILLSLQFQIHRRQVVATVHLQAVAGVEEQRQAG